MYDGIQRPLEAMREKAGSNITRGISVPSLDREKKWEFVPTVAAGDPVEAGDVIGTVQETVVVQQKIMVPYGVSGVVKASKAANLPWGRGLQSEERGRNCG
ncbi:MAG: hypothetical protein ACLVC5_09640 [Clostridia bacterium]